MIKYFPGTRESPALILKFLLYILLKLSFRLALGSSTTPRNSGQIVLMSLSVVIKWWWL